MTFQRYIGVFLIIVALVVGIVPAYFNCLADGKSLTVSSMGAMSSGSSSAMTPAATKTVPMKCYWTSRAAIAVAVPLGLVGLFLTLTRRRESTRALAVIGVASGVFTMLLPTALIGVCSLATASCNEVMKPTLLLAGGLTIVASLIVLFLGERRGDEPMTTVASA